MNESSQSASPRRGGLHHMVSGFSQSALLRVVRLCISVCVTGVLARHLGGAGFGALGAGLALVSLLYTLAELGLGRLIVRELLREGADPAAVIGSSFYTRMAVGVVLFLGLAAYALLGAPAHAALLLIYGLVLLIHAFTDVIAWFECERRMPLVSWCQFAGFLVSVVAVIAGIVWEAPVWFFALTYVIECFVSVGGLLFLYHRHGGALRGWRWEKTRAAALLRESGFEIATQFTLLMLLRLDTIMVQALRGETETGYYSAAVRLSEVAYFLPMMLAGFMMPPLMRRKQAGHATYQEGLAGYFGATLALTLPLTLVLAFGSQWLVRLVFGAEYLPAAPMLAVHAWALVPFALGIARTQYLTIEGRLWANLPAVFIALVLNIVLNLWWIPTHGGLGAAWATLISYTFAWVLSTPCMAATREAGRLMLRGVLGLPALLRTGRGLLRPRPLSPS